MAFTAFALLSCKRLIGNCQIRSIGGKPGASGDLYHHSIAFLFEPKVSDRVATLDVGILDLLVDQLLHGFDVFLELFHLPLLF